jgi:ArsR family metal-binding transcriptional regulator
MLLETYTLEIFNSRCNPGAMAVHCFAHLDQDISPALPYLNAVLGGFNYIQDPPSVTFRSQGKLITVHGDKMAINALKDEAEAAKIVEWLKREINDAWENRDEIEPSYESQARPKVFEVLKMLPKTNCRECGEPTCMVFAVAVTEGVKGTEDCPSLSLENRKKLSEYLEPFKLDV